MKDITAYWLISPLVHACPRPGNLPASFPAITVQGKFLKEAAAMLDISSDNNKERIQQRFCSTKKFNKQSPFTMTFSLSLT